MAAEDENWKDLDITHDELDRIQKAFKKEEFRNLFAEYCKELTDPVCRKQYEDELTQLEQEHGIDITFIHPTPGFVLKTSVNGNLKCFINIASSEKVDKPSHEVVNDSNFKRGMNWKIPYIQAPPRRDYDEKKNICSVYDVVFNTDTLHLASKNKQFKKLVIETACEAIEKSFNVNMDKNNLKLLKNMTFKGARQPTVIRKKSLHPPENVEPSPIDKIYPPIQRTPTNHNNNNITKNGKSKMDKKIDNQYTIPKYQIIQRRYTDLQECIEDKHSKMNITIPSELIVNIELPLLNSTKDVILDITEKFIYLISEKTAKYKLNIELPYLVDEKNGKAKFDQSKQKLVIILPVQKNDIFHKENNNNNQEDNKKELDLINQNINENLIPIPNDNII